MATRKKKTTTKKPRARRGARVPVGTPDTEPDWSGLPGVPIRTGLPAEPPAEPPEPHVKTAGPVALNRDVVTEAVYLEAIERGLPPCEACGAAEDVADRLRLGGDTGTPDINTAHYDVSELAGFYDLRHEQEHVYPGGRNKVRKRGRTIVMREPSRIDTIVVHQTAVEFGVSRRAIADSGGDVELARARRALDVACHAMAFRQGYFVAAHALRTYVNHAHRFNDHSLALEIDGRYPGLADDPETVAREDLRTTWGGAPTELTDQTVNAACAALRWLTETGRSEGMPIARIVSHRQSSDSRRADPGEEIWRRVVLGFAVDELGLAPMRESNWATGRPVPTDWDDDGIGAY